MNKALVGLLALLIASPVAYPATEQVVTARDSYNSTDVGTNYSYVVAAKKGGKTPVVKYVHPTSDLGTAVITFHSISAQKAITTATASGTNVVVSNADYALTNDQEVVIWDTSGDAAQRVTIVDASPSNVMISATLAFALAAGDYIYVQSADATLPAYKTVYQPVGYGPATNGGDSVSVVLTNLERIVHSGELYVGEASKPLLIDINGTAACELDCVTVEWVE